MRACKRGLQCGHQTTDPTTERYAGMAEHLLAFDRGGAITLATRLPVGLQRRGGWGEAAVSLPPGVSRDVFTGDRYQDAVALGQLFGHYPVALLLLEE